MGKEHEPTEILKTYVQKNNMILVDKIHNISIYKSISLIDTE